MLDAADVLRVLDELDRAGLVVWLDGGWGVDALLGHHSRPHQDLDLVIARDDVAAAQVALAGLGFRPDPATVPGQPGYPLDATDRYDLGRLAERCPRASSPRQETITQIPRWEGGCRGRVCQGHRGPA
jgi:aminoglycoside-2''-adenylyltransferase